MLYLWMFDPVYSRVLFGAQLLGGICWVFTQVYLQLSERFVICAVLVAVEWEKTRI